MYVLSYKIIIIIQKMNKASKEIIEKMFTKINEGLAYCKLCDKHLKLVDMIEVEFWRH